MALIPKILRTKSGRTLYKDARGRFISKAKYDLLNRIDPVTGRFITKALASKRGSLQTQESRLRNKLGAPPRGQQWVRIANKYPDRFKSFL